MGCCLRNPLQVSALWQIFQVQPFYLAAPLAICHLLMAAQPCPHAPAHNSSSAFGILAVPPLFPCSAHKVKLLISVFYLKLLANRLGK